MTIPTNISFSTDSCRLSVRCTCKNLDVIYITLNKKRGDYRWRELSDGQRTMGPLVDLDCVHEYLLELLLAGRIPPIKAQSMFYALQDKGLRAMGGWLSTSGHVNWADGRMVIVNDEVEYED